MLNDAGAEDPMSCLVGGAGSLCPGPHRLCTLQSGAIMTVLAAVCTKVPDGRLAIIFLPMLTFTAGSVSTGCPGVGAVHYPSRTEGCATPALCPPPTGPESHHCLGHCRNDPGLEVL